MVDAATGRPRRAQTRIRGRARSPCENRRSPDHAWPGPHRFRHGRSSVSSARPASPELRGQEITMFADRIEAKWIDAFCEIFDRCAVKRGDTAVILSETQSRPLNVQLAELALLRIGARPFHLVVPTPRNRHPVPVRSTGASEAIGG